MGVKERLKKLLGALFHIGPKSYKNRVLYYHSVNDSGEKSHRIAIFRKQIEWLLANNYEFILCKDINNARKSKRWVAITFDDGYKDNVEVVLPILEEYGIKATFFIVSSWLADSSDRHHAYDLPNMTADDVRKLSDAGMEIGNHTYGHFQAARHRASDPGEFSESLEKSKETLETVTGKKVVSFAYPNGRRGAFDEPTGSVIHKYFSYSFTTLWAPIKKLNVSKHIPRCEMSHLDSFGDFEDKMLGRRWYLAIVQRMLNQSNNWYR